MTLGNCDICSMPLGNQKRGRPRMRHPHCGDLADALSRLEKALPAVVEHCDDDAKVNLRFELFSLIAQEIPRPRYPKGHPKAGQFIPRDDWSGGVKRG